MATPQLAQHDRMYIDLIGAHLFHFTVITELKLASRSDRSKLVEVSLVFNQLLVQLCHRLRYLLNNKSDAAPRRFSGFLRRSLRREQTQRNAAFHHRVIVSVKV